MTNPQTQTFVSVLCQPYLNQPLLISLLSLTDLQVTVLEAMKDEAVIATKNMANTK